MFPTFLPLLEMYWRRWSQSNCQQWHYPFGATSAAARFWSPLANFMLWRRHLAQERTVSGASLAVLVWSVHKIHWHSWQKSKPSRLKTDQLFTQIEWINETSLQLPRRRSKSPRRCAIEEASSATWSRTTGVSTRRTYVAKSLDECKAPFESLLINTSQWGRFLARILLRATPPSLHYTYIQGPTIGPMTA